MSNDAVHAHVAAFLTPVDPRGGFLRLAAIIADDAEAEQTIRNSLQGVVDQLTVLPISAATRTLHKQLRPGDMQSDLPASSEGKTLLAVAYLAATRGLQRSDVRQLLAPDNVRKRLASLSETIKNLEPTFLGELLIENDRRAAADPAFSHQLDAALQELEGLFPQLQDAANRLSSVIRFAGSRTGSGTQPSGIAPALGVKGDYDCGGGLGDVVCAAALITIAVVVIVVTK